MKKKIYTYSLLIIILFVQVFSVLHWTACRGFPDNFHFQPVDLELRLIDGIHTDQNMPLWMVRAFHNKLAGSGLDIFGAYLQFWNLNFLVNFISFTGILGIGAQFYYFFSRKKNLWMWMLFGIVLLTPFAEVVNLSKGFSFAFRTLLIALPYLVWSMLGYRQLLQEKGVTRKIIYAVLILSLWYLVAVPTIGSVCSLQ